MVAQNYLVVDFEISAVAFAASSVDFTFLSSRPCFEASARCLVTEWQEIVQLAQLQAHACHKDYNPSQPTIPLFLFESYQLFLSFYFLPFP